MTESERLTADDPLVMLGSIRHRATSAEFRMFAVVCCRRIWVYLNADSRTAVEVAEAFANGSVDQEARQTANDLVHSHCIYVDGDSSVEDRLQGFAAEAARSCVFGDDDYPPIPTYFAKCAIAAAGAMLEVVVTADEVRGATPQELQDCLRREQEWMCGAICEHFGFEEPTRPERPPTGG